MVTSLLDEKKNKKGKREKTKPIIESSYLTNAWHDLLVIWNVEYWHIHSKITQFCKSSTKLHIHKNCVIVFPINILTGVAPSWATRHTIVCLDQNVAKHHTLCIIYTITGCI